MNGQRRCGPYTQRNSTQSLKRIMPTWMGLQMITLIKPEIERQIPYYIICVQNFKNDRNALIYKRGIESQRTDLWLPRGSRWGVDQKFGISRCKLLYTEHINNKALLHGRGNYIHHPVINHKEKNTYTDVCVYN